MVPQQDTPTMAGADPPSLSAQAAQRASEARLRVATEAARIGVWEIDIATRTLVATPTLNAVYGLPETARPTYDDIRALAHPDDRARVLDAFARAVAGEAEYDIAYRVRRADGTLGWVEVRGQIERDAHGVPTIISGVSRDITDKRRSEAQLQLSEESLRLATEAAGVGTWDLDLTTDTLTWSDRTRAMFGISPGAPCSMADFYAGLHPQDRDATTAAFTASIDPARREQYDVEYRTIGKEDGVVRTVAARGRGIFAEDVCLRAIGTAIDITGRRRAERRQAFLLALMDEMRSLSDPAAIMRAATIGIGRELEVNRVGHGEVLDDDLGIALETPYLNDAGPLEGTYPLDAFGNDPMARLRANETLVCGDVALDPDYGADAWRAIGTRAFVLVPLIRDGALRAAFYVLSNAPRPWHRNEVALVEEVASRTWDAFERARTRRQLHESEARLRAVIAAAPVGLVFGEAPDGRVTGGNAQAERILRHPIYLSADVGQYQEWISFHPDGRQVEGHEYPLARAIAGEERPELEVLYRRGDGTDAYVRFVAAPVLGDESQIVGGVVASLDIDRERRTEIRQRLFLTLADRLRALADPGAIVAATADVLGRHLRVSRVGFGEFSEDGETIAFETDYADGVAHLIGIFPTAVFGAANIADLARGLTTAYADVTADPRTRDAGFAAIGARAGMAVPLVKEGRLRAGLYLNHTEVRQWTADEIALVEDVAARTWDALERARAESAVRDLNATLERRVEERTAELSRAEDALRQAQKMEAVGQLTGGIAHDFNNMLAVVLGSLELLSRRLPADDARAKRYVDAANEGARRAATLTQRLLAFSRQQPLQPVPVDVNRLVAGMSGLLRHSLGGTVRLETVLAGGLWPVHADPNQLENVILNLGINARDAMPDGGRVTIETHNAHLDERYVAAEPGMAAGQYVLIAVTDAGTGMSPEIVGKAFDPFFTTKGVGKGTGLGLSQVYGFVKQSGGHVKIYSEVGHGTTVKLYLPRRADDRVEPALETGAAAAPRGDGHELVLVVEDEPAVRAFTVEALGELGYRVLHAENAAAALRLLDANPDVALLFTDIVMPDVDGAKLARAARERRPGLKILFTTGYTRNAVVHNGVVDAGVELIGKPFTIGDLAVKVRTVLDRAPG